MNGHDFADALSISSWAYATKSPMLLTTADGRLTQEEVDAIKADKLVKRVILVGGTSDVAWQNAQQDYKAIKRVPVVLADNTQSGHGGTHPH